MRKLLTFGGLGVFLFALVFFSSRNSIHRDPSSIVSENPNMQILQSIPLVKNIEKKVKDEDEVTEELIEIFDKFADRNKSPKGHLERGTHAKGQCFKGTLEIFPASTLVKDFALQEDLALRMKRGLWAQDGTWPVVMRFANANGMGKVQSDKEPDVRGFSFSVQGPRTLQAFSEPGRVDFMMNSTPQFASGEIVEFLEVVKVANTLVYRDLSHLPNPFYLSAVFRDLKLIKNGNIDGANLKSFSHMNYWSNLPYSHGLRDNAEPLDIVKYKATPCDGKGKVKLDNTDELGDNYLQDEIVKAAERGEVCMLIQIQFMDLEALRKTASSEQKKWSVSDWVENGGLLWDEENMPFHTVGRVTVPKEGASFSHISCGDQYINTRLHSGPENQPMGSIARVRTFVEENSRARRMKR